MFHDVAGPLLQRQFKDMEARGLIVDWVTPDDDARFYAKLSESEVIWHVLRPISAADIARAPR
ncbi:MAG: hypothetical protein ACREFC_10340, partial [Stellaceae bacterium]